MKEIVEVLAYAFFIIVLLVIVFPFIKPLITRLFSEEAYQHRQFEKMIKGFVPLKKAAYRSDLREMERLLKSGTNPNEPDPFTRTPLLYHLIEESKRFPFPIEVFEVLLKYRADPNYRVQDNQGINYYWVYESLLSLAIKNRNPVLVDLLLRSGADPNTITSTRHPLGPRGGRELYVIDLVPKRYDSDPNYPNNQAIRKLLLKYGAKEQPDYLEGIALFQNL
jgi:hypothetical protein